MLGGVTDINTAKGVARKLYMQYCNGGSMERIAMERMLVDTYKVMVFINRHRIRYTSPPPMTLTCTIRYLITTEMAGLQSKIFSNWLLSI